MLYARHEEVCDVEVQLKPESAARAEQYADKLKMYEMIVDRVDAAGVVRGTIPSHRVDEVGRLKDVAAVRVVLTYVADLAELERKTVG